MTVGRIGIGLTLLLAVAGTLGFIASGSFFVALVILAAPIPAYLGLVFLSDWEEWTLGEIRNRRRDDDEVEAQLDHALRPRAYETSPEEAAAIIEEYDEEYILPGVPALPQREPVSHPG